MAKDTFRRAAPDVTADLYARRDCTLFKPTCIVLVHTHREKREGRQGKYTKYVEYTIRGSPTQWYNIVFLYGNTLRLCGAEFSHRYLNIIYDKFNTEQLGIYKILTALSCVLTQDVCNVIFGIYFYL